MCERERERGEIDGYIYIYVYIYKGRETLYPPTLNSKARTLEFRVQGLGIRVCSFRFRVVNIISYIPKL